MYGKDSQECTEMNDRHQNADPRNPEKVTRGEEVAHGGCSGQ